MIKTTIKETFLLLRFLRTLLHLQKEAIQRGINKILSEIYYYYLQLFLYYKVELNIWLDITYVINHCYSNHIMSSSSISKNREDIEELSDRYFELFMSSLLQTMSAFSPRLIYGIAISHPWMTCPMPRTNVNGVPSLFSSSNVKSSSNIL